MGLSRTTVAGIYSRLRAAGYVESRQGAGTWTGLPPSAQRSREAPWLAGIAASTIDFSQAALAACEPFVSTAIATASDELFHYLPGHGYHTYGLPVLRDAVARRFTERGLPTTSDEILVTNGAQQAINLVLETLVSSSARVIVDHPTYPGALDAIRRHRARAVPIGFGDSVWDIEALADSVRHASPQLMYLVPDCHSPTGYSMPPVDRPQVVEISERSALPVIIDETLSELVLDGEDPPPLASFASARHSTLVTIGSGSKLFWGGLRVGWVRAPRDVIGQLAATRAAFDMASPVVDQLAVAHLLAQVDEVRHVRHAWLLNTREALISAIARHVPGWKVEAGQGGLSLWIDIGAPLAEPLSAGAAQLGIHLTPGSRFGVDGSFESYIRIPFTLDPHVIDQGIVRLAEIWRAVRDQGGAGSGWRPSI